MTTAANIGDNAVNHFRPSRNDLIAASVAGLIAALVDLFPITPYGNITLHLGVVIALATAIALGSIPGALAAAIAIVPLLSTVDERATAVLLLLSAPLIGARWRTVLPMIRVLAFWAAAVPLLIFVHWIGLGQSALRTMELVIGALCDGLVGVMAAEIVASLPPVTDLRRRLGRRVRPIPLRVLLFHGFAVISAAPLFIVGAIGGRLYARQLETAAAERLTDEATSAGMAIDEYVNARRTAIVTLASEIARAGTTLQNKNVDALLSEYSRHNPAFITMLVTDGTGRIVSAAKRDSGSVKVTSESVADRPYFTEAVEKNAPFVSGIFRGRGLGDDAIVAISAPIRDAAGRLIGVAEGSLDPRQFARFDRIAARFTNGRLYVIDDGNRVVFGSSTTGARTLSTLDPSATAGLLVRSAYASEIGWRVLLAQPLDDVRLRAEEYFAIVMATILLAIVIAFLAARSLASRVTVPIERLAGAVREFGAARRTISVDGIARTSPREVGELVKDVEDLTLTVSQYSRQLERAVSDQDKTNEELSSLLSHLDDLVTARTRELAEATERAEDASAAKSRFLATMSHELRTPLHGVIGMLRLLEGPNLTIDQRNHLGVLRFSAETLLSLLNDLLDYSKIEAGKLTLETTSFDALSLCRDVVGLMTGKASQRGIALRLTLGEHAPRRLRGDTTRLRQVLLNLVDNAVKFTKAGSVELRLSSEPVADTRRRAVHFEVHDTGIGMSLEQTKRIFDPFTQADESTTRQFGGTGLGLAICRELVTMMGGELSVRSAPRRGSVFYFTVTLEIDDAPLAIETVTPASVAACSGERILVVDDNAVNRLVAEATLVQRGYDVVAAPDGAEALRLLESDHFDLILMDCRMPGMDGFETTVRIRELQGSETRTPIVALTAAASTEERARCREVGMDDFLAKPFTDADVDRVLLHWLPGANASATRASTDTDALDPKQLDDLAKTFKTLPGGLASAIDVFVDMITNERERFDRAFAARDMDAIATSSHRLAGATLQVGARGVGERCRRIESAARAGTLSRVQADVDQLVRDLPHVLASLKDYIGNPVAAA